MNTLIRLSDLSAPRQALVRLFQSIDYGQILGLHVAANDPVFTPAPTIVRELKLDTEFVERAECGLEDFILRDEVRRLLQQLDCLGSGCIDRIEVRAGIPRRLVMEQSLTGEPL